MAEDRVSVVVPLNSAFMRGVIRGVRRFAGAQTAWRLVVSDPSQGQSPSHVHLAGQIVWREARRFQQRRRVPTVLIGGMNPPGQTPEAVEDNNAIGAMAAQHFLDRGFRHFAFTGFPSLAFSRGRQASFVAALAAAGFPCAIHQPSRRFNVYRTEDPSPQLLRFLRGLPKPLAVFACNDNRARHVAAACTRAGLRPGGDVAILGVDNDEVVCALADTPLSSIDPAADVVGYQAASLLSALLAGRTPQNVAVPPRGVVTRESSDLLAITDADVAAAVRFLREHACDPVTVREVLRHVPVSRRWLERRFKETFGRTLHDELMRVRFERARQLLTDTDLTVAVVASRCGFRFSKRFITLFRGAAGLTPGAYRRLRAGTSHGANLAE